MTKDDFLASTPFKWASEDSDHWFYDSRSNTLKQVVDGKETDLVATIDAINEESVTITFQLEEVETQTHPYEDLFGFPN